MPRNNHKKKRAREEKIYKVSSMNDFIVEDENEEDDSYKGEYFEVDSEPLQKELTLALSEKLGVDSNKISSIVSKTFTNVAPNMLDEYCGSKPSNNRWKVGTNEKIIKKIEPELLAIRNEMEQ
jgi:hypothetical protein